MKKKKGQIPKYFENDKYEHFLGIESTEIVYNNRYNDDYYRYEPTSYSGFIVLLMKWKRFLVNMTG